MNGCTEARIHGYTDPGQTRSVMPPAQARREVPPNPLPKRGWA